MRQTTLSSQLTALRVARLWYRKGIQVEPSGHWDESGRSSWLEFAEQNAKEIPAERESWRSADGPFAYSIGSWVAQGENKLGLGKESSERIRLERRHQVLTQGLKQ